MPKAKPKLTPKSQPLEKPPAIPKDLKGKYARDYWKRITVELVSINAITPLHLEALEMLCRVWQDFRQLSDWCEKNPGEMIVEYESGHIVEHPKVRLRQQAIANMQKLWPKFGLTPEGLNSLSKTNNAARPAERTNPMAAFAARRN